MNVEETAARLVNDYYGNTGEGSFLIGLIAIALLQEREACRDAVLFSNSATQAIERRGGLTPVPKHPVLNDSRREGEGV